MSILKTCRLCVILLSLLLTPAAFAAPDPVEYKLGEVTVWAIADKLGEMQGGILETDAKTLAAYMPGGKAPSSFMAFLIRTNGALALVDTGFGKADGNLMAGLAAAGVTPEEVTHVLLTHMHGDHIGGLSREGKAAFPNARVCVGKLESDFWLSEAALAEGAPTRDNAQMAKERLALYEGKVERFAFGDAPLPGLTAMDASGHTPGHTVYLLESGGRQLLFIGDLLHSAALQFPRPDVTSVYDMDKEKTVAARKRLLTLAAEKNIPVAGQHLPFAAIGKVEKAGEGFAYTSVSALE